MVDKIVKNYKGSAQGLLNIDTDGQIYISIEDGVQDVNLAKLLENFNDRPVKISCSYDEEYSNEPEVNKETGEII